MYLLWNFFTKEDEYKIILPVKKEENKTIDTQRLLLAVEKTLIHKNIPPTVNAGEDINTTAKDEISLTAIAEDKDGNITGYVWKEGNQTISKEESFSKIFSNGVHHITVMVTDNNGAVAQDTIKVNVGYWVLVKIIIHDRNCNGKMYTKGIKYDYNSDGKLTKVLLENDGEFKETTIIGYDELGRESSVYDVEHESNKTMTYNEQGQLFEVKYHSMIKNYEYNNEGKLVSEIIASEDGEHVAKTKYIYDIDGNYLVKIRNQDKPTYDNSGKLIEILNKYNRRTIFTYNADGSFRYSFSLNLDKKERIVYNNENDVSLLRNNETFKRYTFDETGHLLSNIDDTKSLYYSYNEQGLKTKETSVQDNLNYTTSYSYNDDGVLTSELFDGANRKDISYYTYNENGEKIVNNFKLNENNDEEYSATTTYNNNGTMIEKSNGTKYVPYNRHMKHEKYVHLEGEYSNPISELQELRVAIQPNNDINILDKYGNIIEVKNWIDKTIPPKERRFYRFVIGK